VEQKTVVGKTEKRKKPRKTLGKRGRKPSKKGEGREGRIPDRPGEEGGKRRKKIEMARRRG